MQFCPSCGKSIEDQVSFCPFCGNALAAFLSGAILSGRLGARLHQNRGVLLSPSAALQASLFGVSVVIAALSGAPLPTAYTYALIIPVGVSMGLQNGIARKLAVPDLSTTVLTLTLAGLGSESHIAGGGGSKAGRRLTSVAAMFLGGLIGALLILRVSAVYPLVIALAIMGTVAIAARMLSRKAPTWTSP